MVAIYNDTLNSAIIGRIRFKNPINNSILVEHWLHFIDNVVESPSYAKPLVSRYPGCSLHILSYANVKKSKRKYRYSYIVSYNALTAICFVDIAKKGDNYLLWPSLVKLQQKATKQYDLVNAPTVTPTPSTTPVDSSLADVVLKYIPTPVTRSQLHQLKQNFKFARTLEFSQMAP